VRAEGTGGLRSGGVGGDDAESRGHRPPALSRRGIGAGEQRVVVSLSVSILNVGGMSERRFRCTPGGVVRARFPYLRRRAKVLWSPSYFAASVGYVSESTARRYIEHPWDAVAS
jgi:hypothetical protein